MRRAPDHVLIAGGGVAGIETLLALRALAGDRVDITLLTPEAKFVNRSMAIDEPSNARAVSALRLADIARELDARWHRGALQRVEPERRVVVTERGEELHYDRLVLALGARPATDWRSENVLTYRVADDAYDYRRLLRQLHMGRVTRLAFVRPAGACWPLPLYELALATADECDAYRLPVELSLVTPEADPLEIFGARVSTSIREALEALGVCLYTRSRGVPSRPGRLYISPGGRRLEVDRIVTVPRLLGPSPHGVACDRGGFIRTDDRGRVVGMQDVFAAGDGTAFAIKQGGLATQQADVVAAAIAAAAGARIEPRPFRPVLRGLLMGGGTPRYMRTRIAAGASDECEVSDRPLWWPPNRLCGRYLAPYLSAHAGGGAAMFQDHTVAPVAVPIVSAATGGSWTLAELADLSPS